MRQVSPGWHKELYWVLPESGSGHFNSNQLRRNHHSLKSGVSPTHLPGNLIVSLGFFSTPKLLWHNFSCYLQSKYAKLFSSAGKSSEWWESALCGLWSSKTLRHSAVANSLCVSRSLTWSSWTLNSLCFFLALELGCYLKCHDSELDFAMFGILSLEVSNLIKSLPSCPLSRTVTQLASWLYRSGSGRPVKTLCNHRRHHPLYIK